MSTPEINNGIHTEPGPGAAESPMSLKMFFLLSLLWLPLACFFWFSLRSVIVFPITRVAHWLLDGWLPGVIHEASQYVHYFKFTALVPLPPGMTAEIGQIPAIDGSVNALLYTYGLAVFWALTFSTPDSGDYSLLKRLRTALLGWLILIPIQALGIVADVAKQLFIDLGAAGQQMADQHQVNLELIAYAFQAATLVVPMLSSLIVWALFHRRFLEHIRFAPLREPETHVNGLRKLPEDS